MNVNPQGGYEPKNRFGGFVGFNVRNIIS